MALHLHTAERTDALADGLAHLLATPLSDPFAREVVVVPARGVERWLTQRLSHRLGVGSGDGTRDDGVCAGVDFLSPHSLVAMLLGRERDDPWDPDRLVWPVLATIDECLGEPGFERLSDHLGHDDPTTAGELKRARRYGVARRLAGLFTSYSAQRPTLLSEWLTGQDGDGAGGVLDSDLCWQAELWRRLVARMDVPPPDERHRITLEALRSGGESLDRLDLPSRLSLFGHTRLPITEVQLLAALGEVRDVHLWLPQISAPLWRDLADLSAEGPVLRDDDTSASAVQHPLLAALGRDARELRRTLASVPAIDVSATAAPQPPDTLLGWLQDDLRANRQPTAQLAASRRLDPTDRSVQVHACHGSARQVDVLREVLVGLLQDDPTLEPRDILVMCPDIESYAPLISAGFGLADLTAAAHGHPAHQLRVRLADRSPGATNPLLALSSTLVEVAGGRMSASQVLDIAGIEAVRARFGWDDDGLEQLDRWIRQSAIRWGFDAAHRADFEVPLVDNTWVQGMRRILLGAAVSGQGHRVIGATLPLDDVGDSHLDLAGRFIEFIDRLHTFVTRAHKAATARDWTSALGDAIRQLTLTAADDVWQVAQFDRELATIASDSAAETTRLRHADIRSLMAHRLRGRPTRSNFRTGTLTVCTMVPMRSVPHRVVCLVGLDDGVFPRGPAVDGDNVLARRPRTGERDPRSEDRQLLLDAINAATETLVITYTGRGEHTGSHRPPAVPLGELIDALDLTATAPDEPMRPAGSDGSGDAGRDATRDLIRDWVVVQHPLQPFDEANFVPKRLGTPEAFTFDTAALAGATAARRQRPHVRELLTEPLAPTPATDVSLDDLHEFFRHPVKAFFKSRLAISTPHEADEVRDEIPITLDALERWAVGDRLVRDVLAGADPQAAMLAEQLRGLLPPNELGLAVLKDVAGKAQPLVISALGLRSGTPRTLDVDIDLGDRRLTGTIDQIFGNHVVTVSFSNLGPKQRIVGWLNALALAAGRPEENWTIHTIGRHRSGGQHAQIAPLAEHEARAWLRDLVEVMERGQREPLSMPLKTAAAWAADHALSLRGGTSDPDRRALLEWETPRFNDSGFPKEDSDAWHVRAFGPAAPFDVLTHDCRDDENSGPHRLGHYAWRVWGPVLTDRREQVGPL